MRVRVIRGDVDIHTPRQQAAFIRAWQAAFPSVAVTKPAIAALKAETAALKAEEAAMWTQMQGMLVVIE